MSLARTLRVTALSVVALGVALGCQASFDACDSLVATEVEAALDAPMHRVGGGPDACQWTAGDGNRGVRVALHRGDHLDDFARAFGDRQPVSDVGDRAAWDALGTTLVSEAKGWTIDLSVTGLPIIGSDALRGRASVLMTRVIERLPEV
ncbi:hypothetical protein BH20CHL6_BH20CHL6_01890 [soil metagenome]